MIGPEENHRLPKGFRFRDGMIRCARRPAKTGPAGRMPGTIRELRMPTALRPSLPYAAFTGGFAGAFAGRIAAMAGGGHEAE